MLGENIERTYETETKENWKLQLTSELHKDSEKNCQKK